MTKYARQLALGAAATLLLYGARRYYRNWGTTKGNAECACPATSWSGHP